MPWPMVSVHSFVSLSPSYTPFVSLPLLRSEGAVAQSIERATPGEEVLGSIPAVAARSLLVGSVSV